MALRKQKSRKQQAAELAADYLKVKAVTKTAKGAGKGAKKAAKGTAVYKVAKQTPVVKRIPVVLGAGLADAGGGQDRPQPQRRRAVYRLTVIRPQRPHGAELSDLGSRAEAVRLREHSRLELGLAVAVDPQRAAAGPRAHDLLQFESSEQQRDAVIGGVAGRDRPVGHRARGTPAAAPARRRRAPTATRAGSRGPGDGAGVPIDVVIPHSNQHIAPADSPASTTPDSQHSRRIWSRPSARHTASSPSIEPPPTYTTSCASSVSRSGIGRRPSRNSEMWIGSHARAPNVAWNWRICASPSPEAVGNRQIRGIGTPASPST